jgi:hypothetical protein
MPERRGSVSLLCAALAAMALIAHDLHARRHGEASYEAAQAIAGGYAPGEQALGEIKHQPLKAMPDDAATAADQLRADATWAKVHHARTVADCPANSRVFYAGCVAAMRGDWPSDPD